LPDLFQVELDTGQHHEQHHAPLAMPFRVFTTSGLNTNRWYSGMAAQHARAEHDAHDDLDDRQRRKIIGPAQPPDQEGRDENQQHRQQKDFGGAHMSPFIVTYYCYLLSLLVIAIYYVIT
jgi:hypothetical protein